jgi:hypothetical protein
LIGVWRLLSNNFDVFTQPQIRFWPTVVTQVANLRLYAKKTQIGAIIPLSEVLTGFFCKYPVIPNVSHYAIWYFGSFLLQTLKSVFDNTGFPAKRCLPFVKCCYKLAERFGSQLRLLTDFCSLFQHCYDKLQPIMGAPLQNLSAQQQALYQFVYDVLFPYLGKMMTVALRFDPPVNLDGFVDILMSHILSSNVTVWPYAARTLHLLLAANSSTDKIKKLIEILEKENFGIILFPLFWLGQQFNDIRHTTLLPFIIRCCSKEGTDAPINTFMLNVALKTMVDFPSNQTVERLCAQVQPQHKRFCSLFLPNLLLMQSKTRRISKFVDDFMQDAEICQNLPTWLNDSVPSFPLSHMAKLVFAIQKDPEQYLSDLSTVDIRTLINVAKRSWGLSVPLSFILSNVILFSLDLKEVFQMVKGLRKDVVLRAIDDFLLNPPVTARVGDLSKFGNLEELFPLLTEVQVDDLIDAQERSTSKVSVFLHHGMLRQALFSAKESLNSLRKEDLLKIRVPDGQFPPFSVSSLREELHNSTEIIDSAANELPIKVRLPFHEKFAIFLLHSKYNTIGRGLRVPKRSFFRKSFSHFFEPNAHKAFAELRSSAYALLRVEPSGESRHEKTYRKSRHQYFIEDRKPLPSADELVSQDPPHWKQMILCFLPYLDVPEWRPIFERIVVGSLKDYPGCGLFLAVLFALLKQQDFDFGDVIGNIPLPWILPFCQLNNERILPHVPESFLPDLAKARQSFDFFRYCDDQCLAVSGDLAVPLSNSKARIFAILPRGPSSFSLITTFGERLRYRVTPAAISDTPFATFLAMVGSLFEGFVDTAKRGMRLPYIASARLPCGSWVTRTDAIPLGERTTSELSIHWRLTFAYRYAALSSVQILLQAAKFDDVWVDEGRCFAVVGRMPRGDSRIELLLPGNYLDEVTVRGPLRAGLVAAGVCLGYHVEKIKVFVRTLIARDAQETAEVARMARAMSIAETDVGVSFRTVHELITRAAGADWQLTWL